VINAQGQVNYGGCGGNALYSAAGAHVWNTSVAAVGRAAPDFPKEYLSDFAAAGVDVSQVRYCPDLPPRRSAFIYDETGKRQEYEPAAVIDGWGSHTSALLADHAHSGDQLRRSRREQDCDAQPNELPAHFWRASGFHIAPMKFDTHVAFSEALRERGTQFTLDPGHAPLFSEYRQILPHVPVFLPSEEEAQYMMRQLSETETLEQLASAGSAAVVIKLGRRGSLVYDTCKRQRFHVPIYPADVQDPTGAGDSYCGGFLVGWVETGDALEAALRATVSASFVVEGFDARYALRFSRRDAEARLGTLRGLLP
jgi:ribokinase